MNVFEHSFTTTRGQTIKFTIAAQDKVAYLETNTTTTARPLILDVSDLEDLMDITRKTSEFLYLNHHKGG